MQRHSLQVRKALLSVGVLAVFILYSYALRHQDSDHAVVPPPSIQSRSSRPATSGGAQSGGSTAISGTNSNPHYKDGTYTGSVADAFYGNVQVEATIKNGSITDVQFLQYPNDNPNSQSINSQATPFLRQEAIQAQSASVDIVTGATYTSQAFIQSLSTALNQARV